MADDAEVASGAKQATIPGFVGNSFGRVYSMSCTRDEPRQEPNARVAALLRPENSRPNVAEAKPMSAWQSFTTFNPVGKAILGYMERAAEITSSPVKSLVEYFNWTQDFFGYGIDAVAGPKKGVLGDERPYEAQSGLVQSVQQIGVLGTIGNLVHGSVLTLPGVGTINALYRKDAKALGASGADLVAMAIPGALAEGLYVARRAKAVGVAREAAPGAINLMKNDDPFFVNASKRTDVDPDGFLDIIAHGNETHIEVQTSSGAVLMDSKQAAQHISSLDEWKGQNIRLLSCSTGACLDGFAAELQSELAVSIVRAPSDILWADAGGSLFVSAGRNIVDPLTGATQFVPTWPPSGKFVDFTGGPK